ncbi:putative quinol monooxygenase [Ideonella sp. DXS22W]|uniref:Quinol monooxygenase n=1 Tax=Pseudaquabacterium inlustre TaxID=2984192 RepID=A0ABU9CLW1_9BURK
MIILLGSVVVQPGRMADALALAQAHVARSRLEPGCLEHGVHRDSERDDRLVFIERWADLAALQQHFQVPASNHFVRDISALAAERPAISIHQSTELPWPGQTPR